MAKVCNCSEDVLVLAFISELQVPHPLYKHMLKHDISQMSEVLSRAQPHIQLEEAMKNFVNHSLKRGNDGEKMNSQGMTPTNADNHSWGQPAFKKQAF